MKKRWGSFFTRGVVFDGRFLYAGRAMRLSVFDLRDPGNPEFIRDVPVNGTIHYMVRDGNFLYCAAGDAGLLIFDISRKGKPKLVSRLANAGYARNLGLSSGYAYVAYEKGGLGVVDIRSKNSPRLLRFLRTGSANFVKVDGSRAYVSDSRKGFLILDISRPQKPGILSQLDITYKTKHQPMDLPPYDVALAGYYAYVANGYRGVSIINVKNPRKPILIRHFPTHGFCHNITVRGSYAYLTVQPNTILMLNVKNPEKPMVVKKDPGFGGFPPFAFSGKRGVFFKERTAFYVVEMDNPTTPKVLGAYKEPATGYAVTRFGKNLYLSAGSEGLKIFSIKNPEKPSLAGVLDTTASVNRCFVSFPYAYLSDGLGGVVVADVRYSTHPEFITSYNFDQHPWDVIVHRGISYLATGTMGLTLYDVSNPRHPDFLSEVKLREEHTTAIDYLDKKIFLAGLIAGIYMFDVRDAKNPVLAGHIKDKAIDVKVMGSYVYFSSSSGALKVLNWKQKLKQVGACSTGGIPMGLAIKENRLYLADLKKGLFVIDISMPQCPQFLRRYKLKGNAWDVSLYRHYAYVACGDRELAVINLKTDKVNYLYKDFK